MPANPDALVVKCPSCQHEWEKAWQGLFSYINCGKCNERLRVPMDKGTLTVRCPKCAWEETVLLPTKMQDYLDLLEPLGYAWPMSSALGGQPHQGQPKPEANEIPLDGVKNTKQGTITNGKYIWRSGAGDILVNVIGIYGMGSDGKVYVKVEETTTGIPEDQLVLLTKDS